MYLRAGEAKKVHERARLYDVQTDEEEKDFYRIIQKAVDKEQKDAAQMMKFSQSGRMFMQFAVAAVGVLFLDPIASIVPLFFPRIAIAFRPFIGKKNENKAEG